MAATLIMSAADAQSKETIKWNFDFGQGKAEKNYIKVSPGDIYTDGKGYGFEDTPTITENSRTGKKAMSDGYITSAKPFRFSAKVPEGNYDVTVTLGDDDDVSDAAIRVENRRMMINRVQTAKGEHKTVTFTVHVRDSIIKTTGKGVKIKPRERLFLQWDDKLTIEINGANPKINAISIAPASKDCITVFLAGNSTVVDQSTEPWAAWGQMFPSFFVPGKIAIANYAESGETIGGFIAHKRFEKMLSMMKPGDYAFVEFGHNDQKQKGEDAGPYKNYTTKLGVFIDEVRKKGGIPVIVTPVKRRRFDEAGKVVESLGEYPDAARKLAADKQVPLIDLNAKSQILYEAWGEKPSIKAFVHYPMGSFPGQTKKLEDNTHFSTYGAYEIAKLVLTCVREQKLGIVKYIQKDVPEFDPAKPGKFEDFYWPLSPAADAVKPDGN
ncbi:MAG: GDSL-type esterase/lipase family protein [Edaphocola sp.]